MSPTSCDKARITSRIVGSESVADDGNTNRRGSKNGYTRASGQPNAKESSPEEILIGYGSTDERLLRLVEGGFGLDISGGLRLTVAHSLMCFPGGLNARSREYQAGFRNGPAYNSAGSGPNIEDTIARTGNPGNVHVTIVGGTVCPVEWRTVALKGQRRCRDRLEVCG